MNVGDYATGLAWLGVTFGAVAGASWILRRRRLAHLRGAVGVLATAILVVCGLAAVHLVPLALGILSRPAVAVTALLALSAALAVPRAAGEADSGQGTPGETGGRLLWWAAGLAAAGAAALFVAGAAEAAGRLTTASDLVAFDLPVIGQWIQSGSAWHVTELFPFQTHGTYPHNAHLVLLAAMLPWENDGLVRFAVYPFLALLALAVYTLGRELGAARAAAVLFAAVLVTVPVVATMPEFAPLDLIGAALFACGLVFLVRGARTARTSDLVLAGLGLGFGLGAKWYLAAAVAAVLVVWMAAGLVAGRGARAVRDALVVTATAAAAGGFWLVRNWVEAGDPLYPVPVKGLGVTLWDAPPDLYRELVGFSLAHYLGDWGAWREHIVPDLRYTLGVGGALVVGAGLVSLVAAARRRAERRVIALALCVPALAAVYVVTPYTAFGFEGEPAFTEFNVRYAIPLLVVAAGLAAWLSRAGRWAAPVLAILGLAAAAQGTWASAGRLGASRPLVATLTLALVAAGLATLRLRTGSQPFPVPPPAGSDRSRAGRRTGAESSPTRRGGRGLVAVATAVAVAGLVLAGWGEQRAVNRDRYAGADPVLDWVRVNAPGDARIGTTGYFDFQGLAPAWPLFGERIGREVEFVGSQDGGRVEQYGSRAAWERRVRGGRYDLLLVAQGRSPFQPDAREPEWAAAAGFAEVARGPRFVLYSTTGGRR